MVDPMPTTLTPAVRLKVRKDRATIACVEISVDTRSQCIGLAGQGVHGEGWITRTSVNRSQFVDCGEEGTDNAVPGVNDGFDSTIIDHHPRRPARQAGHGTNEAPTHTASPLARSAGSPTQGKSPAGRRSSRITQSWPVMGTADVKTRGPKTAPTTGGVTAETRQMRSCTQPVQDAGYMTYRHGDKRSVTADEIPAAWEEGEQPNHATTSRKRGLC
jgi:hypothetical protein